VSNDESEDFRRLRKQVNALVMTPRVFDPETLAAARELYGATGDLLERHLAGDQPDRDYLAECQRLFDAAPVDVRLAALQMSSAMLRGLTSAGKPDA
jgi:hypothetical protein